MSSLTMCLLPGLVLGCTGEKGGDTGTAPIECPTGSHLDGELCAATLTGWEEGPALDAARDHQVSFAAESSTGPALYVAAGTRTSGAANDRVERAWIGDDGSLGDWEDLDDLPEGLVGPGLAQDGSALVMVGGLLASGETTSGTLLVTVGDDGGLTVAEGPELTTSRYHPGTTMVGGYVFTTGGLNQTATSQDVLDSIERASFAGGVLGAWEDAGTLDAQTTHHAVFAWDGHLYVVGGGATNTARDSVLRASVDADGQLGAWEEVGLLPEGRATSAATVFLDQVYIVAGMTTLTGGEVDTVLRATLQDDGSVGDFEELAPLPSARAHSHQAPLYEGVMYSLGGSIDHEVQDGVYLGRFE
jgi:hypothetical protein